MNFDHRDSSQKPTILDLRHQVDEVHQELFLLFMKRIQLTEQIWQLKKTTSVSLESVSTDQFECFSRDFELIHQFDDNEAFVNDESKKLFYQAWIQQTLYLSKKYLTEYIKKNQSPVLNGDSTDE